MVGYVGTYCIERGERNQLYKRTRISRTKHPIFPMNVAVIAIDSHSNYVIYTLLYEPVARGNGTESEAIGKARRLQRNVDIEWERVRYITRCGVVCNNEVDIYLRGKGDGN